MTEKLKYLLRFAKFWPKAKNAHGLHSPFIFSLYNEVINAQKEYYAFAEIEKKRNNLLKNHQVLQVTDFGAGAKAKRSTSRKISGIAKSSLTPPRVNQLLFKLVETFRPLHVLELGTSLGINTCYLASPVSQAKVFTLEGCPEIAKIASKSLEDYQNIQITIGDIAETLPETLRHIGKVDFVFLDANHQYTPTLAYFEQILPFCHQNTILVFDDIHWSADMEKAWKAIIANPEVKLSLDLFRLGIVFFREKQPRQHFDIRFKFW